VHAFVGGHPDRWGLRAGRPGRTGVDLPCSEVVAVKVLAENDYAASCKDGNKYYVCLSAEGRLVAKQQ
jgi:hypothetical protein